MSMDALPQRKIKIGNVSVGLIGLDVALNKVRNSDLSEKEAVDRQTSIQQYVWEAQPLWRRTSI